MRTRAVEMTGWWTEVENQKQVSHLRPPPLEIANAISTFPQPRPAAENWKTKTTFPTFPLDVLPVAKINQKGAWAADRFAPASRLILG